MAVNRANSKTVFKSMGSQTIVTIAMGVLEILYFAIMSRLLSQEDFGYFAIITAVTAVMQTLTEAGLGSSLIQKKDPSKEYIATAFTFSLITGGAFMLLLIVTSGFFSHIMIGSDFLTNAFRLMSITLLLSNVNSIARAMMMRNLDFLKFGLYQIIAYIVSAAIGIYMAYLGYGFYSIIFVTIINQVCVTIILFGINRFNPGIGFDRKNARGIISYGGWLTGSAIIRSITEQLDKLILTNWLPIASLGAFNRPSGFISRILSQINGIFDTILYPILSSIQDDKTRIKSSYIKAISLVVLYSLILTYLFILGAKVIMLIFFGKEWLNLTSVFQIISISIIFLCYSRIADCFFRSIGIVKKYFFNRLIICILTVLSLFLGCQFGLLGVAWALVISRGLDVIVKTFLLRKAIEINRLTFYRDILKICLVPTVLFVLCIPLCFVFEYGSILALVLYILFTAIVVIIRPHLFGSVFYDNIYLSIRKIIKKQKKQIK